MCFGSSTWVAENRTRWKRTDAKPFVVSQRPCKGMGYNRIEKGGFIEIVETPLFIEEIFQIFCVVAIM